jgi:hypothetical protein
MYGGPSCATPGLTFDSGGNSGLFTSSAGAVMSWCEGGIVDWGSYHGNFTVPRQGSYSFSSTTAGTPGSSDIALVRIQAGMLGSVIAFDNLTLQDFKARQLYVDFTNTATVGAVTINKAAGQAIVAASGTSVVVTDSLVTANSQVFCTIAQNDATAILKNCVASSGSFTITLSAAATANTSVNFFVLNQ